MGIYTRILESLNLNEVQLGKPKNAKAGDVWQIKGKGGKPGKYKGLRKDGNTETYDDAKSAKV
ncbi:MAG: hypothetical protein ABGZ35_02875, partial [Planctomycetaceae bacterium]